MMKVQNFTDTNFSICLLAFVVKHTQIITFIIM